MRILSWLRDHPDMLKDAWGVVAIFLLLEAIIWIGHGLGISGLD